MASQLLKILLFLQCLDMIQCGAEVYLRLKTYSVNGRDWDGEKCDLILNVACDPMFKFCLDSLNGQDNNFDSCSLANFPRTGFYKGSDDVNFIHTGYLKGDQVKNPIHITLDKFLGFKFKVEVWDDDSRHSGHDLIDRFNIPYDGSGSLRPALSSAQAQWVIMSIRGKRVINPSQLLFELLVFCQSDYYGPQCDKYCVAADSSVDGHYTCDPLTGDIVCRPLWENVTEKCTVWKDDCSSNPCMNGATCEDLYKTYHCKCAPGFTGTDCEVKINECLSSPCQNGGSCIDEVNSYTCSCPPNYNGVHCELHLCGGTAGCLNGGACIDNKGNQTCYCPARYTGVHCETDKCQVLNCKNGGVCIDGECKCPSIYLGELCDVDKCTLIKCQNGGTCTSGTCSCKPGFSGDYCHAINECISNPCQHEGTCYDGVNGFTCRCLPNYNGHLCENVITPQWNKTAQERNDKKENEKVKVSKGGPPMWVIGLIAAIVALILVIIIVAAICIRQKRRKDAADQSTMVAPESPNNSFNNPAFVESPVPNPIVSAANKRPEYNNFEPGAVGGSYDNSPHYDNPRNLRPTGASMNPPLKPEDWTPVKPSRESKAVDNVYSTMIDFDGSSHNNDTNDKLEQDR